MCRADTSASHRALSAWPNRMEADIGPRTLIKAHIWPTAGNIHDLRLAIARCGLARRHTYLPMSPLACVTSRTDTQLNNANFKDCRIAAIARWMQEARRHRYECVDDNFADGYECRWQARADNSGKHISLFCGVGEWACHVTDCLSDASNDDLSFTGDESHRRRLFRQYGRLLLISAELLNDFEDALKIGNVEKNKSLRTLLGPNVDDLQAFVNSVVKHKAKGLHLHDHHLPIEFSDNLAIPSKESMHLGVKNFTIGSFKSILVPSFSQILDIIFGAYCAFDTTIASEDVFNKLVLKFGVDSSDVKAVVP